MTGRELMNRLAAMGPNDLERQFVVYDNFCGVVTTNIKPYQVSLEESGKDGYDDTYPDCIMLSLG